MDDNKQERPSFSKGKITSQYKGLSGVTSTSEKSSKPIHQPDAKISEGLLLYESSELLNINIDKLADVLNLNTCYKSQEIINPHNEIYETQDIQPTIGGQQFAQEDMDITGLSEDEIIADLDRHLGISKLKENTENPTLTEKDLFCRSCGNQYYWSDNYCARCGKKRGV